MAVGDSPHDEIARRLAKHAIPGCALVARVGEETISHAFGTADVAGSRAVDEETVFHLFSGTKLYTATALMKLVEAGTLSLDSPVREVLPDLELKNEVTLRQLASHSSGLSDTLRAFMSVHLAGEAAPSTADALSRYATGKGGKPGAKAAYRNVNYAILGEVITRASGMPYADYVVKEVLEPLGAPARFTYDDAMRMHAAEGTIRRLSPMRLLLHVVMPGLLGPLEKTRHSGIVGLAEFGVDTAAIGGLVGRARDFLPLAVEMLSLDDGLLSAESKRTMLTIQARGQAGIASAEGVGIGWKLGKRDGATFWNHEGGGPGFTSETRIYPDDGVAVVILMNATQSRKLSMLAHDVCELVRSRQ